jgi:hypothetical protein
MAENIFKFQDGREAAMAGMKRDTRKHKDWLAGYDEVKPRKDASYASR